MVATGRADFGVVGADDLLSARASGADVIPIFATFQTSPQAIMAHASRGVKSLADVLSAGTLAIDPGVPYAAFLRKKYGFDKVKVVPYDGGVARFVADKDYAQQCFVSSEPIAATRQGSDPKVFMIADEGYNPYSAVVITRRALWTEHPDEVRAAFVRAAREGLARLPRRPEARQRRDGQAQQHPRRRDLHRRRRRARSRSSRPTRPGRASSA